MGRLDGRLCVITGAGRGIGRAVAQRFLDEGAELVVANRRAPAPMCGWKASRGWMRGETTPSVGNRPDNGG
ncbi:SDR family NAD(P)-dependent oxidoreductase [Bifidobacterium pullorum]|uniref:SDR family NAD(P)-dependent oxidoreductase n=1 Tax=Bifidobacterium pullorum TaxID=78448 RepID=UPI000AD07239|nr:SDR family NAD(P)-dependent oxidoreductase [Bifidobacterium pullorum]MBE5065741.1 SDR family NAD(P)-dependent oxidoreductase [Bifidobacterium pullorum subsp. saeculare]MDM8322291.1 SDR family NAD(P)-dependent oxidoreductase [Bifidobacterium pullorum]